jgi:hypothetical protein
MKHKTLSANNIPIYREDLFLSIDKLFYSLNSTSIIVPHICNNIDVFGGGFTAGIVQHYPIVEDNYHMLGPSFLRKNLGHTQFIVARENKKNNNKIIFANMISQNGTMSRNNPRPLNYLALCKSMVSVVSYTKTNIDSNEQQVQIHCPKFGSGLAGGNWAFIQDLISDIWSGLNVFVYDNSIRKN